jgi:hypothetical protein
MLNPQEDKLSHFYRTAIKVILFLYECFYKKRRLAQKSQPLFRSRIDDVMKTPCDKV